MKQYLDLLKLIKETGTKKEDRTGTGTISIFGHQMRFDLQEGFPLMTTKKVNLDSIIHELLWFIKGDTNIRYLVKNGVNIWNDWPFQSWLNQTGQSEKYTMHSKEWKNMMKTFVDNIIEDEEFASQYGDLGPVYGKQWRDFEGVDQLNNVIQDIKKSPDSRRLIVSAWNPTDVEKMALPPCHCLFQFYVSNRKLSCQLYQRSADIFLGVPFNIASYALLTMMIAKVTKLELGEFVHTFGDAHLYSNHLSQAKEQLARSPKSLPKMKIISNPKTIFDFEYEDFVLEDYDPHPHISAPVAV